jgi:hypothetical protein
MKEIERVEDFEEGDITCDCGEKFTLYFNGGELDQHKCRCGRFYKTVIQRVDLVVYAKFPEIKVREG